MVRIIPSRLKSSNSLVSNNSRGTSPLRPTKGESINGKDMGLVLKIVVIRARNLAAKDRGGTSDPYLQLTCGETKFTTHCVQKTLNPEWNVICTIPITGVDNLLLECHCWDKDRFSKDYLGEFDLALEEIFANDRTEQEPRWYALKNKKKDKKSNFVSGEVLLQCTLFDSSNKEASDAEILEKLRVLASSLGDSTSKSPTPTSSQILEPISAAKPESQSPSLNRNVTDNSQDDDDDDELLDDDETPEEEDPSKPEAIEKRKRRLRIRGLKRKKRQNPYEFSNGGSDVVGLIFLEICHITDLPPESNFTKTGFDMDPFVVASLGKKTYRTRVIRHNLNPVFNEKMLFQVQRHEQAYSFAFTVIDRDKISGNDFIASTSFPLQELIEKSPQADPETGLYDLKEPAEYVPAAQKSRLARLGLSRSASTQSLAKGRQALSKNPSPNPAAAQPDGASEAKPTSTTIPAAEQLQNLNLNNEQDVSEMEGSDFYTFTIPLKMKNLEKWEAKHNPVLTIRAKYMPYPALRQQFWRAMLKQYDTDESGEISKVELTTMLDTLGSTLRESTIDSFFQRFPHKAANGEAELTMDEAVICLEDQLQAKSQPQSVGEKLKSLVPDTDKIKDALPDVGQVKQMLNVPGHSNDEEAASEKSSITLAASESSVGGTQVGTSTIVVPELDKAGEDGEALEKDDLNVDRGEEHVVEIRECPICHQPRLNKRNDADIVTHIATCASQDWRRVNSLVMGGFVTASQAQRKWYSKIVTKISYGGYKLGANSANILVQDRLTGQINEEKMSVYVRLGIRLLYKGLKSKEMEKKRIRKLLKGLSIKQGKKYDDPASKSQIKSFIEFHQLDMSEVLRPIEEFKNFNEFFYRELKPDARPCSAPDNQHIIVSPADCRSVVFNSIDVATNVWIKGREFSIKRLLGDAYPEDAPRYENGALGIFRLAPQDYHRFHIPVDGILRTPKTIAGEYYTVNPMAIRSALDVYGENVRVVCPIDSEQHGRVMVICVGAMMVGSTVITRGDGEHVKRAEELGYFKFGGSTIVVLFEPGKMVWDADLVDNSNGALETLIRAGMSVGHSPHVPQFTPDMRKDASQVTEAEKIDAHRRIRGGLETPEEVPLA
ncbi:phosphatidylserine decarboxylase-domain-containing protein [Xylariaceae sp. FL0594]|nr:phosphatidylserine decarboxylase-domain-containing protein [Xylariaceae sp. FL0594]